MAELRENPYGAFNFQVSLQSGDASTVIGGFSDVSGLGTEINFSEYRNGSEKVNTVRKIANTFKQEDVTLKRGLIGAKDLYDWVNAVREGRKDTRKVTITLLDESRAAVAYFHLTNAQPKKWVGPTLAAKGGGEVAMEELHLVHEGIVYE